MLLVLILGGIAPFLLSPVKVRFTYRESFYIRIIYACFSILLPRASARSYRDSLAGTSQPIMITKKLAGFALSSAHLTIHHLELRIASDRADKTACLFFFAQRAAEGLLSYLKHVFSSVKAEHVFIYPDFCSTKSVCNTDFEISVSPIGCLRLFFARRALTAPCPKKEVA